MFDIGYRRVTLVLTPVDMRCGYESLSRFAQRCLFIDPDTCREIVIFVSKKRGIAKLIWADEKGAWLLTRRLHKQKFARFEQLLRSQEILDLTQDDVWAFLNGDAVPVRAEKYGF